jgi:hypothetical protein
VGLPKIEVTLDFPAIAVPVMAHDLGSLFSIVFHCIVDYFPSVHHILKATLLWVFLVNSEACNLLKSMLNLRATFKQWSTSQTSCVQVRLLPCSTG